MRKAIEDRIYRPRSGLRGRCKLDVYVPDGGATGFPTVLWFYGGGLVSGERGLPEGLRDQGVAVVTPDYRLYPATRSPGFIEDAAAAAAWTLQHAASFGGDPRRVHIAGVSAGAYLAALVTLDRNWMGVHRANPDRFASLTAIRGEMVTHAAIRRERGIPPFRPVVDVLAPLFHVRRDAPPIHLITADRGKDSPGRHEENAYFQSMLRAAGHTRNTWVELTGVDREDAEAAAIPLLLRRVCGG